MVCCCGSFVSFQFTLFTLFTAQREVPLIVHPPRCLTPPSSSFVCSGLLISSSSSPPSMSSRKHTLFPCHLVGARVTAPLCPERPCFLPWLSGTSSLTVCVYVCVCVCGCVCVCVCVCVWGGGLGRRGPQAPHEEAPNGMSCCLRRWPFTSLAGALSSRRLKALGVVVWDCCRERTPRGHGGVGEGRGERRQGKRGISVEALERASGVPPCLAGAGGGN